MPRQRLELTGIRTLTLYDGGFWLGSIATDGEFWTGGRANNLTTIFFHGDGSTSSANLLSLNFSNTGVMFDDFDRLKVTLASTDGRYSVSFRPQTDNLHPFDWRIPREEQTAWNSFVDNVVSNVNLTSAYLTLNDDSQPLIPHGHRISDEVGNLLKAPPLIPHGHRISDEVETALQEVIPPGVGERLTERFSEIIVSVLSAPFMRPGEAGRTSLSLSASMKYFLPHPTIMDGTDSIRNKLKAPVLFDGFVQSWEGITEADLKRPLFLRPDTLEAILDIRGFLNPNTELIMPASSVVLDHGTLGLLAPTIKPLPVNDLFDEISIALAGGLEPAFRFVPDYNVQAGETVELKLPRVAFENEAGRYVLTNLPAGLTYHAATHTLRGTLSALTGKYVVTMEYLDT